ncbi:MAG: mandelate racemase/muconate lactonizing enzyme family protein [Phycisphaerae bacterium]|jgi:L-alanine-DL-glutamate epimerase-like enolase superfamily enzyme|nr:mandelate racemase/muconate lactonizing enzyme family protein [Phycisphaerae bacterium]
MDNTRRNFIKSAVGVGAIAAVSGTMSAAKRPKASAEALDRAAAGPVLKLDGLSVPIKIASVELMRGSGQYFVRVRSTDGAEGVAITNSRAGVLHPIFRQLVAPYFVGKDARTLDSLVDGVYVYRSNYKLAGLPLWCCVAWIEFAILDMLGKMAKKPVGDLLGGVVRRTVPIYIASGRRGNKPQQEATLLAKSIEKVGAKAVKFKVGARMRNNADSRPGRPEALIPLVRKTLGDKITLHVDSNGSYDAPRAIEVGKLLQDHDYHFFEEPCPFDHLEDTRRVADALKISIAGGECEGSVRRFRWMIRNSAVQIVQPDLHYYGGMIRAMRVARMAAAADMAVTVHMSGGGVGYVDMLQFASCVPNIGAFQEYKGGVERTGQWYDPPLKLIDGAVTVPTGPGMGLASDAEVFKNAKPLG